MCVCAVRVYVSVCLCARASRSVHVRVWVYGYVLFTASYSLLLSSPKLQHLKRVSLADVALDTDVVRRSGPRFCSVCLAFSTQHASHPTRVPNARAQVKVRGRERGRRELLYFLFPCFCLLPPRPRLPLPLSYACTRISSTTDTRQQATCCGQAFPSSPSLATAGHRLSLLHAPRQSACPSWWCTR